MASPRVLIVLMPALALVGGLAVWGMRGPTAGEAPAREADAGGELPDAPELDPVQLAGGELPDAQELDSVPISGPRIGLASGRVLRWDGTPAPFARVVLRPAVNDDEAGLFDARGLRLPGPDAAIADRKGEFTIAVPSEGDVVVIAEPAVSERSEIESVQVRPAESDLELRSAPSEPFHWNWKLRKGPSGLTLRLRRPGRLEVRVVDERGRALPQARVDIASGRTFAPDGLGLFIREDMVPGPCELSVSSAVSDSARVQVEVVEAATVAIQVALRCGVRVSGTVVDPDGKPVPSARVRVVAPRGADGEDKVLSNWICDENGHFELGRLPEGPLRLHADADGFDSLGEFTDVAGDTSNVRVRGQWLGRARLRLVTSDGRPLPGSVEVNVGIPGEPHPFEGTADVKDGVIVVSEFSGENEQLVVDVPGYAALVRTVRAAPGKEVDLGTVTLDAGHDVEGVVVTSDGTPVFQASVRAAGNRVSDFTTRDGRFHLPRLPAGPVDLVVSADGYLTLSDLEVVVGTAKKEPLRLVLRRACVVRAKVEGPDGKPAAGERLVVVPGIDDPEHQLDLEHRAFRTEDDGTFVVSLPPGPYRIQAEEGGRWILLGEITLADGEHRELALKLPSR